MSPATHPKQSSNSLRVWMMIKNKNVVGLQNELATQIQINEKLKEKKDEDKKTIEELEELVLS
jgi:hypothetical protein